MRPFPVLFALVVSAASPALASSGVALIVANEDYATLRDARGAASLLSTERALESAGFAVDVATDLSANALRAALSALSERLRGDEAERVVIVFAGYTLSADHGQWLLGTEARAPDLAAVEGFGVRLETVLALAGQLQGGAVVAVGDYGFPDRLTNGFRAGLPAGVNVPQGVTLVSGQGASVGRFVQALARPGTRVGQAARDTGVALSGFDPAFLAFLPAGYQPALDAERRAWEAAQAAGTVAGYDAFLAAHPDGEHAAAAQAARASLLNTPERIEGALGLTRDERRAIQRDLTILGYEPRGIDGIFGAGTRAAIGAWQGANRFAASGYLNRDQIFELAQQGARRAAQLEAEARARQIEQERLDRAYWRDTGSGADEAGLRAYLTRYPDGIFASVAQERLAQIEADRRAAAQARDRSAWDAARGVDSVPAYQAYLRDFPQGAFAAQARDRIDELTRPGPSRPEDDGEARAAEEAMRLPAITRQIIEQRLERLGLEPGVADGNFDRDTRRAIRRYQRAADLPVTGYLTPPIVARLLAEGMLDVLR